MPTLRMSVFGVKRTSLIRSPMVDRYGGSMPAGMLHAMVLSSPPSLPRRRSNSLASWKVTINITEKKLTENQLEQYRQGRVRSAIAQ